MAANLCFVIPFLHVWRLSIPTYGLMVAIGMVGAYFVLRADIARRAAADDATALAETLVALPCLAGIAGARLYDILESPGQFLANPFSELFSQFGFTWTGGLVAGFLVLAWLARRHKIPLLLVLDMASPAAAIGYGFGRMGCLLSGDGDYGIPTSLPWGMSFPNGLVPTTQRVHPTPIYEFIGWCAIAWVLWRMGERTGPPAEKGRRASSHLTQAPSLKVTGLRIGTVFAAYLALTGVARFLVEFIRINPHSFFGLTNAQAASLLCIFVGAGLWWRLHKQRAAG
jgi:phosphatidylglycerol---prolipoprotein diacylglyceryl transferase